ncbi:alpha/beta fold hydrolase [Streptomyces sp. 11x1]|uniref:thioesterase II family protein n=1 Tax=Streptomyces sp. 11x1 TaxID=3038642 RepID=UPI0029319A3A|nr:alpha/beta fold hydrolase [Streptomyces sp. 11x1]WNZ08505.1 alpha/beta fold hydrolase [Streptomyces sp. 11x1]
MTNNQAWLTTYRPRPTAPTRLVVFPHAGGSASFYRPWADLLPPTFELQIVQYPGRENRMAAPMIDTMEALVAAVAEALVTDSRRTVLFGHSLGASAAYEVLRLLQPMGVPITRLCLSSREFAPGTTPSRPATPRTDASLMRSITRLGGTPAAVLEDPDLRAMLLDIVRNDYLLLDRYHLAPPAEPLPGIELSTLTGAQDPEVRPGRMKAWSSTTTGPHSHHVFPGDHFYLTAHTPQILKLITA